MAQNRNKARIRKHIRIRNKISGTAKIPRINVFKSLKNMEAQLIDDVAKKTLAFSSTQKLKLEQGGNIEAAKLLGQDFGKKVKAAGINNIVFDRSGYLYHGRVKAFADAVRAEGVKF